MQQNTSRNYYVSSLASPLTTGHIEASTLIQKFAENQGKEGYYSVFDLEPRDDYKHYQGAHSPALGWVVLDFDAPEMPDSSGVIVGYDTAKALHDAKTFIAFFKLPKSCYSLFFSGSKGYHLYLRQELFQGSLTAYNLKRWATDLKATYPTIDTSLYSPAHKLRAPYSLHPKTKKLKERIEGAESLDEIPTNYMVIWSISIEREKANYESSFTSSEGSGAFGFDSVQSSDIGKDDIFQTLPNKPCIASMLSSKHPKGGRRDMAIAILADYRFRNETYEATYETLKNFYSLQGILERFYLEMEREINKAYGGTLTNGLAYYPQSCTSGIRKRFCSNTCPLYRRLDKTKRADLGEPEVSQEINNLHPAIEKHKELQNLHAQQMEELKAKLTIETKGSEVPLDPKFIRAKEKEAKEALKRLEIEQKKEAKEVERLARKAQRELEKKQDKINRHKEYEQTLPVSGFKEWGEKGPKATIGNIRHMLSELNIEVRYDVIKKDLAILIPNSNFLIDTEKNDKMNFLVSQAISCDMNYGKFEDFIAYLASKNPYNPVADWIDSKPWDGVSRLGDFYATVTARNEHDPKVRGFKETLMRRWMVSAIAAAYLPNGVSAHGVLVFQGDQYVGKTNWALNLAPKELKVIKDGAMLDPRDKDSTYESLSHWIVELGELDATFKKAEIAQLKAFIPKAFDSIRLPYRREPAKFARRTVFFGSVNDKDYLNDPTGNRRFWTIGVAAVNHTHGLDMQQIWAEFKNLFDNGEPWHLSKEEMIELNEHNEDFIVKNPIEEKLIKLYKPGAGEEHFKTTTEIAELIGLSFPKVGDQMRIGRALTKLGVERVRRELAGSIIWGYEIDLSGNNSTIPDKY